MRCRARSCRWHGQLLLEGLALAGGAQAGVINSRAEEGGGVGTSGAGVRGEAVGVMGGRSLRPGRSRGVVGGWGKGEGVGGEGRVGAVRAGAAGQTVTSAACCLGAGDGALGVQSVCWISAGSAGSGRPCSLPL